MKTFDYIWETVHRETQWGKYPSEEIIRFVARNFYNKERKKTKMLDVGCGGGAICWYLAREGFDTYGFDGSPTAVEKAKAYMEKENLNASIMVSDAANLQYENEFFHGIIDSAVIYANKVDGIRAILKECYRVLKKEGKFFSTGLFKIGMSGYGTGEKLEENTYRELTEGSLTHRGTVHFFSKEEIEDLWKEAGFKNIKVDEASRSDDGGKSVVSYFMVQCEK